jgi:hypothetical protein
MVDNLTVYTMALLFSLVLDCDLNDNLALSYCKGEGTRRHEFGRV